MIDLVALLQADVDNAVRTVAPALINLNTSVITPILERLAIDALKEADNLLRAQMVTHAAIAVGTTIGGIVGAAAASAGGTLIGGPFGTMLGPMLGGPIGGAVGGAIGNLLGTAFSNTIDAAVRGEIAVLSPSVTT